MTKTRKTLRPLAALATAALLAAGCGSDAASEPAETGSAESARATTEDRAVKFAECMRNNGLSDFPDPNAKGQFAYGIGDPAAFDKAVKACKELQPPGSLSAKRTPQEQSASLRFAACMRENGVKDFPDPANGEPLVDTTKIPSSNRPGGMTILNAAMERCRRLMDEAAAER